MYYRDWFSDLALSVNSKCPLQFRHLHNEFYEINYTTISVPEEAFLPAIWWELEYDSQEFFNDNMLTIILNNEVKDELLLEFKNGFWEVIAVK